MDNFSTPPVNLTSVSAMGQGVRQKKLPNGRDEHNFPGGGGGVPGRSKQLKLIETKSPSFSSLC